LARQQRKIANAIGCNVVVITANTPLHAITKINGHSPTDKYIVVLSVPTVGRKSDLWDMVCDLLRKGMLVYIITRRQIAQGAIMVSNIDKLVERIKVPPKNIFSLFCLQICLTYIKLCT